MLKTLFSREDPNMFRIRTRMEGFKGKDLKETVGS